MREHENEMEQILLKFRPAEPPERLRARVLAWQGPSGPGRNSWTWLYRGAVAAVLVFAFGLNLAADSIVARAAMNVGVGPAVWTAEAEQAAQMLNGNGWARKYIALGLMARPRPAESLGQPIRIPGDL